MQLPEQAQLVYADWWKLVAYAAGQRDAAGNYSYTATDLNTAAKEIATAEGLTLGFQAFTGLAQLFGIARRMERAGDTLSTAPDTAPITDQMIAQAPWARPEAVQMAQPEWQLRAEITYRDADGNVITTWSTGVFRNSLSVTVGALRTEAQLQIQRLLAKRTEDKHTGGELLSVGRVALLAV